MRLSLIAFSNRDGVIWTLCLESKFTLGLHITQTYLFESNQFRTPL